MVYSGGLMDQKNYRDIQICIRISTSCVADLVSIIFMYVCGFVVAIGKRKMVLTFNSCHTAYVIFSENVCRI